MVEADYPNSPFMVGEILTLSEKTLDGSQMVHIEYTDSGRDFWYESDFNQYPHIFRRMHWSEGRKLEEMPRWVKVNYVASIWLEFNSIVGDIINCQFRIGDYGIEMQTETKLFNRRQLHSFTPATEAEYLEYLKTKEK